MEGNWMEMVKDERGEEEEGRWRGKMELFILSTF